MDALGKLLIGYSHVYYYEETSQFQTSWDIMHIDCSEATAVRTTLEKMFQKITLSLLRDAVLTLVVPTSSTGESQS